MKRSSQPPDLKQRQSSRQFPADPSGFEDKGPLRCPHVEMDLEHFQEETPSPNEQRRVVPLAAARPPARPVSPERTAPESGLNNGVHSLLRPTCPGSSR